MYTNEMAVRKCGDGFEYCDGKCGTCATSSTYSTNSTDSIKKNHNISFVENDTYLCPECGCMFKRDVLGDKAPDYINAVIERESIECINCGHLGMNYQIGGKVHCMMKSIR